MKPDSRHQYGRWYTPQSVADLALALALQPTSGQDLRTRAGASVVDPCCGDGAFLTRARGFGIAENGLYGVDVDRDAVLSAQARLPAAKLSCGDTFDPALLPIGGFDAVVGNPPYVRQERLAPGRKQQIRQALAQALDSAGVAADPRDLDRLVGRGDLAAACIVRAATLARPGARISLVVSSALLAAGYADSLWRTLAALGRVVALIDAPRERWFADAAVNAIILVMERIAAAPARTRWPHTVTVARLRQSTVEAAARVRGLGDLDHVADIRHAPANNPDRWPTYLRAPSEFFEFERLAGANLVPLGSLAQVRRGVTSGANEFFYLEREHARTLAIEPAVLMPVLRSPRDHNTISVTPERCPDVALVVPKGDLERYPAAARYVRAHEHLAGRRSLRARTPWWALPVHPARLFFTKAYSERFVQHLAPSDMVADQRVYAVHPRAGVDESLLAAILNATCTAFTIECLGRASMGEGALEWTVADVKQLPVLDPRRLSTEEANLARNALHVMRDRPIATVADEHQAGDRRALDHAVTARCPELGAMLPRIWPAFITAVGERTMRATRNPV